MARGKMAVMEFTSRPSRIASRTRRIGRGWPAFVEIIRRYAQASTPATPGQLNPQDLQVGQSVYDNEGNEQIVVESPQGGSQKTLMPKDQQGQQIPQVQTVDDPEIATQYSLQPTTPGSPKQVQQPTANRQAAYADEDDPYYDSPDSMNRSTAEDWMTMPAGQTNIENWQDLGGGGDVVRYDPSRSRERSKITAPEESDSTRPTERPSKKSTLQADMAELNEFVQPASPMLNGPALGSEEDALRLGEPGYTDIMNSIRDMVDAGYSTVDVMLTIGEVYPREIGQRVLSEARERGVL